jgi:hypothetical protein
MVEFSYVEAIVLHMIGAARTTATLLPPPYEDVQILSNPTGSESRKGTSSQGHARAAGVRW